MPSWLYRDGFSETQKKTSRDFDKCENAWKKSFHTNSDMVGPGGVTYVVVDVVCRTNSQIKSPPDFYASLCTSGKFLAKNAKTFRREELLITRQINIIMLGRNL